MPTATASCRWKRAPPFLKKQFAKIDTNGDGFLDKAELEAWIRHHRGSPQNTPEGDKSERLDQAGGETAELRHLSSARATR